MRPGRNVDDAIKKKKKQCSDNEDSVCFKMFTERYSFSEQSFIALSPVLHFHYQLFTLFHLLPWVHQSKIPHG